MVKKTNESAPPKSFRKPILLLLVLVVLGWWGWENGSEIKDSFSQYVENADLLTLESKFTPEEIKVMHQEELIGISNRAFREPVLKYYPYLLMDVKFTENRKSRSGFLLWGMVDGEMVLDTDLWTTTQGFKECLECRADRQDMLILKALMRNLGSLSVENLQKELQVEPAVLEGWLASSLKKHLIVRKGSQVHLHFENPALVFVPQTKIQHNWVSMPGLYPQKVSRRYSKGQIEQIAEATFGSDFSIRGEKEVFLPVYLLEVQNPDGSVYTTAWNAITGSAVIIP